MLKAKSIFNRFCKCCFLEISRIAIACASTSSGTNTDSVDVQTIAILKIVKCAQYLILLRHLFCLSLFFLLLALFFNNQTKSNHASVLLERDARMLLSFLKFCNCSYLSKHNAIAHRLFHVSCNFSLKCTIDGSHF